MCMYIIYTRVSGVIKSCIAALRYSIYISKYSIYIKRKQSCVGKTKKKLDETNNKTIYKQS